MALRPAINAPEWFCCCEFTTWNCR